MFYSILAGSPELDESNAAELRSAVHDSVRPQPYRALETSAHARVRHVSGDPVTKQRGV